MPCNFHSTLWRSELAYSLIDKANNFVLCRSLREHHTIEDRLWKNTDTDATHKVGRDWGSRSPLFQKAFK